MHKRYFDSRLSLETLQENAPAGATVRRTRQDDCWTVYSNDGFVSDTLSKEIDAFVMRFGEE